MNLFNKYPHPVNFNFVDRARDDRLRIADLQFELQITSPRSDVYRLKVLHSVLWPDDMSDRLLEPPVNAVQAPVNRTRLTVSPAGGMRFDAPGGKRLLGAADGSWFGVSGQRWLFRFKLDPAMQFYGLGEKHTPFERSGRAYWFWNTDAWADHPIERVRDGEYDPDYLSIPYLIIKQGNTYIGLLLDTPWPAMISIAARDSVADGFEQNQTRSREILMGAENGAPSLYLLYGPSLAALTRKFQALIGTTPLPPIWSLGYHQSRWGYRGAADLTVLADRFESHRFPADGLWLDIDYMDGYRVFTFDARHLPRPRQTVAALKKRGFRTVPILDPGIKPEPGYAVYDSGRAADIFCYNSAGTAFTGIVWPGQVVFPDFSLPEARQWWADYARRFLEIGFAGFWLDMNDPSTGSIDCRDMRFARGRKPHEAYHNCYARLMAEATRKAMLAARPDRRPFLLSRSGSTGSQKSCAHWTGDNFSTYGHLQRSIGKALNLALSGVPFNGADVGGFGGDCSEALLVDWFKAAFLMPLFRNHTMRGSRPQEPWAYSKKALDITRRFVRLRYMLLPYLYNLFIEQEQNGEAILRPLFYDFNDSPALPLGDIDDQFMVGPAIMQAPFLRGKDRQRDIVLPEGKWLRAETGRWVQGPGRLRVRRQSGSTPLFVRPGSLIPFQPGTLTTNRKELRRIGLLGCLPPGFKGHARMRYSADDGASFKYQQGKRTTLEISARLEGRCLHLTANTLARGFGPVDIVPYSLNRFQGLHAVIDGKKTVLRPVKETVRLTGRRFEWYRWVIDQ
jgi:alpha-glucosidase